MDDQTFEALTSVHILLVISTLSTKLEHLDDVVDISFFCTHYPPLLFNLPVSQPWRWNLSGEIKSITHTTQNLFPTFKSSSKSSLIVSNSIQRGYDCKCLNNLKRSSYIKTRILRSLRAPISSWRPFGPLDFNLCAHSNKIIKINSFQEISNLVRELLSQTLEKYSWRKDKGNPTAKSFLSTKGCFKAFLFSETKMPFTILIWQVKMKLTSVPIKFTSLCQAIASAFSLPVPLPCSGTFPEPVGIW